MYKLLCETTMYVFSVSNTNDNDFPRDTVYSLRHWALAIIGLYVTVHLM